MLTSKKTANKLTSTHNHPRNINKQMSTSINSEKNHEKHQSEKNHEKTFSVRKTIKTCINYVRPVFIGASLLQCPSSRVLLGFALLLIYQCSYTYVVCLTSALGQASVFSIKVNSDPTMKEITARNDF
jgi:hypothetical protein